MDPKGHMEKLGYTWRYSNMSWVLMRKDKSADLQFEGTLGQVWLPKRIVSSPEAREVRE